MALENYKSIMDILEKYSFDVNKQQYHDLFCVICNGILKNPYRSLCDCKYCFSCFEKYIAGGEKLCPGKIRNCQENITSVLQFIRIDKESIEKLFKIIVKCPIKYCEYKDELKSIAKHINLHQSNQSLIDYSHSFVGNENEFLKKSFEYLDQEMNNFTTNYTTIENLSATMNNKLEKLKSLQVTLNQDFNFLLENLFENDKKTLNFQNNLTNILNNNQKEIDEIGKITNDYLGLQEKINERIQIADNKFDDTQNDLLNEGPLIADLQNNIKDLTNCFQDKTNKIAGKINELMHINENIKLEHEIITKKNFNNQREIYRENFKENKISNSLQVIKKLKLEKTNNSDNQANLVLNPNKGMINFDYKLKGIDVYDTYFEQNSCAYSKFCQEFEWKVSDISTKKMRAKWGIDNILYSDTFYSYFNGYKMCLVLYPNGVGCGETTHLSVGFLILPGKYDNILPWPIDFPIIISVIYPFENQFKVLITYDYGIHNPNLTYNYNTCYRIEQFIDFGIINSIVVSNGNSIIIRCSTCKPL